MCWVYVVRMTTTQNAAAPKITFRIAKRFGNTQVWAVVVDGTTTAVLVKREAFDYANRTEQFSILDRNFRGQMFTSKRAAAEAGLA